MQLSCRVSGFLTSLFLFLASPIVATETAIFAGGCFWCLEHDFQQLPGVISVVSGYCGGSEPNPTYSQVSSGKTGYVEAVNVTYDEAIVSYPELLDFYWKNIDPTQGDGQFCDQGPQYRPVIFYLDETQKKEAEISKAHISIQPNKVEIRPATSFYPAEEYHQDYAEKNPFRYQFYRYRCGRDARLKELWP